MTNTIPSLHVSALLGVCLAAFAGTPTDGRAEPTKDLAEVAANADLTEEGKLVPRPTPGQPAYYVPIVLGWHETGHVIAGEEPPKREMVLRELAQALAKEGYILQALRPDANTTAPSLIIAIEWGYMNSSKLVTVGPPDLTGDSSTPLESPVTSEINQRNMITLVAGSAVYRRLYFTQSDWDKVRDAVDEDRYYIIVSAYDFASSLKGEQKLLWRTRMSTPRHKVWMNDVVPALVTTGAAFFGRQTGLPEWKAYPVREGRVDMGDIKVLDSDVKVPTEKKP